MRKQVKVSVLCEELDNLLVRYGYSEDSMRRYRKVFREFQEFSNASLYSQKLASDFLVTKLSDIGGFVTSGENSKNEMYYLRVTRSLADLYNFGTVFRRKEHKGSIVWAEEFRESVEGFLESKINYGNSRRYVWHCSTTIKDFILHLDANDVFLLSEIKAIHISSFIRTLVGFAPKTISSRISALRNYLRYLYLESYISIPLAEVLPHTFNSARIKLPTVWSQTEIEQILNAVDLGNPCGRRDYAMILMMARLGLRVGDIRALKLSDIDWERKNVTLTQCKTGEQLVLPLPDDVGWAIIDYLKHGRPITECPNVFVRHLPPFDEIANYNNLQGMMARVVSKAKIPPEKKVHASCHTLRHSLASNLLQNHVDVTMISNILGHADPNTAKHYLRVDVPDLRLCALAVGEVRRNV